jgi:hypothetical protein
MGFRFHRSVKVFPGFRVNFSKRGVSYSVGGHGATVNIGPRGVRRTLSLPGTGLSYTSQVSNSHSTHRTIPAAAQAASTVPRRVSAEDLARLAIVPSSARAVMFGFSGLALLLGISTITDPGLSGVVIVLAFVGFLIAAGMPTSASRFALELARRQAEFRRTLDLIPEHALTRALIAQAIRCQQELRLTDAEIGLHTVELLHGYDAALEFEDDVVAHGSTVAPVEGQQAVVGTASCVFVARAAMHKRGADEVGTAAFTIDELVFVSHDRTSMPWKKVALCTPSGRALTVQREDRQTATDFTFSDVGTNRKAAFLATKLIAGDLKVRLVGENAKAPGHPE